MDTTISRRERARPGLSRRSAYTVIELLVVLTVIGIVAAMALPRIDVSKFRVDAASRGVRGALQQAQRAAIVKQHDIIVSFDLAGNRLRTLDDRNNDGIADAVERVRWTPMEEGARFVAPPATLSGAAATALVGADFDIRDNMPSIVFHANGAANTDAEIYLTSDRGAADHYRAITLVQATGRTDMFQFHNGVWQRGPQ